MRSGREIPHPASPDSRTDAGYRVHSKEGAPGTGELFRMNHERATARANPTATQKEEATCPKT